MANIQKQGQEFDLESYINSLDGMIQKKLTIYQELERKIHKFKSNYFTDKPVWLFLFMFS